MHVLLYFYIIKMYTPIGCRATESIWVLGRSSHIWPYKLQGTVVNSQIMWYMSYSNNTISHQYNLYAFIVEHWVELMLVSVWTMSAQ